MGPGFSAFPKNWRKTSERVNSMYPLTGKEGDRKLLPMLVDACMKDGYMNR